MERGYWVRRLGFGGPLTGGGCWMPRGCRALAGLARCTADNVEITRTPWSSANSAVPLRSGAIMTEQAFADVVARIEQAAAEIKIPGTELVSPPTQLTDIVAQAGFQSSTGTIAFAGQYATGSYAVQYNEQNNGGFSSSWPQW